MLGLCHMDGFLHEDCINVRSIFNSHFQNKFSPYNVMNSVGPYRDSFYRVAPQKVPCGERHKLYIDISKEIF